MTIHSMRSSVAAACVVFAIACSGHLPTAPTTVAPPSQPEPPTQGFPPVSHPARIYQFNDAADPVQPYTRGSRYVLYDNGAFVLQYVNLGEYRGTYSEASGSVRFSFDGWSSAGPWGATGVVDGEALSVTYNIVMVMSDFENAVYVRTHASASVF